MVSKPVIEFKCSGNWNMKKVLSVLVLLLQPTKIIFAIHNDSVLL